MSKLLIIHHGGGIGGAPVSLLHMVSRLDRAKYSPKIVFSDPGPMLAMAEEAGVATATLPMPGVLHYGAHVPLRPRAVLPALVGFPGTVAGARDLIRSESPDLVHLNTSALIALGVAARKEGVPIVWHVREVVNPDTPVGRLLAGWIFRMADRVIAVSRYVASGLPDGDKVSVVHNAVDTSHFDPARVDGADVRAELRLSNSDMVVGILGSVQAVKGHFVLVEAASRLLADYPNAKFVVVGGGAPERYARTWKGRVKRTVGVSLDNQEKMRRVVARHGMDNSFRFCGYQADVAPYVAAMDMVAAPALRPEGCPRPLLEGMSLGRPVVASAVGPSSEVLGDEAGILCLPGSADSLAEAIGRLAGDPDLRRRMGEVGRSRAVERFNIDRHVAAVSRVYESVLSVGVASPISVN